MTRRLRQRLQIGLTVSVLLAMLSVPIQLIEPRTTGGDWAALAAIHLTVFAFAALFCQPSHPR